MATDSYYGSACVCLFCCFTKLHSSIGHANRGFLWKKNVSMTASIWSVCFSSIALCMNVCMTNTTPFCECTWWGIGLYKLVSFEGTAKCHSTGIGRDSVWNTVESWGLFRLTTINWSSAGQVSVSSQSKRTSCSVHSIAKPAVLSKAVFSVWKFPTFKSNALALKLRLI